MFLYVTKKSAQNTLNLVYLIPNLFTNNYFLDIYTENYRTSGKYPNTTHIYMKLFIVTVQVKFKYSLIIMYLLIVL